MAEPQVQAGDASPRLLIEVRFFPGSRCLFLFAEDPHDPLPLPADEVLQQVTVRLRGSTAGTHRTGARSIDVPYRVDGRIGGVPVRDPGRKMIRILRLEPMSPLAALAEERIRRHGAGSSCVTQIHLLWPDGREETYARRPGHKLVFSLQTSS